MDKLTLAHQMAVAIQSSEPMTDMVLLSSLCFSYADAMFDELEKRKDKSRPAVLEDWQPDWSQAPEWANWWVATANQSGKITGGWFYDNEPKFGRGCGPSSYSSVGCRMILTDSFGYTGDWRNSLRIRPSSK